MTQPDLNAIPGPDCPVCLARLAEQTVAGCGLDALPAAELSARMMALMERGLRAGTIPAAIASEFFALARQASGVEDPFHAKKQDDFMAAREAAGALGEVEDSFTARAKAAILGNAIEHFFLADTEALWQQGAELELGIDHLARAGALLRPGGRVVILADNCGEQSFDRLLAEHLEGRDCTVDYVVKTGPVQNDLCMVDLEAAGESYGLGRLLGLAPRAVGLDPEVIPAKLAALLDQADLVIAKGMGHYETLAAAAGVFGGNNRLGWPVLFLFLAKCATVAASAGAERGQGVALLAPLD